MTGRFVAVSDDQTSYVMDEALEDTTTDVGNAEYSRACWRLKYSGMPEAVGRP